MENLNTCNYEITFSNFLVADNPITFSSLFVKNGYYKKYVCDGITSPVILTGQTVNFESEDCDIIYAQVEDGKIDITPTDI